AGASRDGLAVRAEVHDETGAGPAVLPERVASALLRTAQGALANVREHARARTATLTLTLLDDLAFLDIADDGRGFVPDLGAHPRGPRGHGLPATRARLEQLGGTLSVESAPGEGTVLTARVPLHGPQGDGDAERTFSRPATEPATEQTTSTQPPPEGPPS
ncbi:ATP-binding protein, partial [Streptomyces sp. SID11385]|uniref:sensor histidine kinase n=1 Tax=Streptomyces sp. SID11385 TaxID=2706031 RepID=UPI0031BA8542